MPTTVEHIAVEALRAITKTATYTPETLISIAQNALDRIEQLQGPPAVHHLDAVSLDITEPPGGGA